MRTIEELEKCLSIDPDNLEIALEQQSQLFWECAQGYAKAFSELDQAKQILEQGEAALSTTFRQNSTEKITEKRVEEYINAHPDYVNQYIFVISKEKETNLWKGLMRAFDQRGDRLRDLVSLANMGYFGSGLTQPKLNAYFEAREKKNKEEGKK